MSPPMIFFAVEKLGRAPKSPALKIAYETGVFILALMVCLPASIAMFPQTGVLTTD